MHEVDEKGEGTGKYSYERVHVVEQRVSNLAQGLLTLGTMTGPLLVVLHLIPHGVLAGLFFIMGFQALQANGITAKLLFLARDKALTPASHPLRAVKRRSAIWLFVAIELIGFGATFAITQTIAAIGFPVFIFVLLPIRAILLPRIFRPEELALLDEPTASPFIMKGIGGAWNGGTDEGVGSSDDTAVPSASPSQRVAGNEGQRSEENLANLGLVESTTKRRNVGNNLEE